MSAPNWQETCSELLRGGVIWGLRMYLETKTKSKTRKNQILLTKYRGKESGG